MYTITINEIQDLLEEPIMWLTTNSKGLLQQSDQSTAEFIMYNNKLYHIFGRYPSSENFKQKYEDCFIGVS